ncbi:hypothetical protein AVEN_88885-1 [Araneus ventricosus]|uniref:Uncharacterized protein n=1 Tax=Araneus ventricosus TaxID=182803 RepID=A0A4Y2MGH7_ARAVE|nr:hypothetical protein AVEN_88885-1 [Araneus ventricosus]
MLNLLTSKRREEDAEKNYHTTRTKKKSPPFSFLAYPIFSALSFSQKYLKKIKPFLMPPCKREQKVKTTIKEQGDEFFMQMAARVSVLGIFRRPGREGILGKGLESRKFNTKLEEEEEVHAAQAYPPPAQPDSYVSFQRA